MQTRESLQRYGEVGSDLLARARTDRDAFGEVYDQYVSRVYAFCRMYVASREEAEDLTAHTFEQALGAIGRYDDRGLPFSSWLLRIAHNLIKDRARRVGRAERGAHLIRPAEETTWLPAWEHAFWLRSHVDSLPVDQRMAIQLRFYEDCQFTEIAQRMGRSEGAAKQLTRRALAALFLQMQQEGGRDV